MVVCVLFAFVVYFSLCLFVFVVLVRSMVGLVGGLVVGIFWRWFKGIRSTHRPKQEAAMAHGAPRKRQVQTARYRCSRMGWFFGKGKPSLCGMPVCKALSGTPRKKSEFLCNKMKDLADCLRSVQDIGPVSHKGVSFFGGSPVLGLV